MFSVARLRLFTCALIFTSALPSASSREETLLEQYTSTLIPGRRLGVNIGGGIRRNFPGDNFTAATYRIPDGRFTSSVSYCAPPQSLLIQRFDVAYIAANSSINFNVSAASVEPNINVTANLLLNVYGMQPLNLTIDLCSILSGALCPLPTYNFTGTDSIPLPSTIDVKSRVPGIAYKIPDLEAFAQLTLIERGTGEVKACVQSTLANGWSTRQPAVEWSTGAIALLALGSSLWHASDALALAPFRLLDLLHLYQSIAATALLNINTPLVYRSFALNFAWAFGIFSASAESRIQNAIDTMRHRTGGRMPDANGGSATDLVNRKLSPYNVPSRGFAVPQSLLAKVQALPRVNLADLRDPTSPFYVAPRAAVGGAIARRDVATVTSVSPNVLEAGVPVYVNSLGIATANAFMSVFITVLMLAAIVLAVLSLGWVSLKLLRRSRKGPQTKLEDVEMQYPWFARAWGLRLCLIAFFPITIFAFYQWTLKDSWLSIAFSVFAILAILASIIYTGFQTVFLAKHHSPWALYTHPAHVTSTGPLYAQYRHPRWNFFIPALSAYLIKAAFIAFAHSSGIAQVIGLLIVELGLFALLIIAKPHAQRGGDVLALFLSGTRILATGLLFAFVERFAVKAIPRVAVGIVLAVVFSIAVLVMFANTLANLGLARLWAERVRLARFARRTESDASMLEKHAGGATAAGQGSTGSHTSDSPGPSRLEAARPRNPTPQHNIPLDPKVNRPYPQVTPTPTTASLSPPLTLPSMYDTSEDSGSTTLGSVLPRRRSFDGFGFDEAGEGEEEEGEEGERFSDAPSSPRFSDAPSSPRGTSLAPVSAPVTRPPSRATRVTASAASHGHGS